MRIAKLEAPSGCVWQKEAVSDVSGTSDQWNLTTYDDGVVGKLVVSKDRVDNFEVGATVFVDITKHRPLNWNDTERLFDLGDFFVRCEKLVWLKYGIVFEDRVFNGDLLAFDDVSRFNFI